EQPVRLRYLDGAQRPASALAGAHPPDHAQHRRHRLFAAGADYRVADPPDHCRKPCEGHVSAELIDGKAFAEGLRKKVGTLAAAFEASAGRKAGLAVVLV